MNNVRREIGSRRTCPLCKEKGLTPETGHSAALKTNADGTEFCFRCGVEFGAGEYRIPLQTRLVTVRPSVSVTREEEMEQAGIQPIPSEPKTRIQAEMLEYLRRRHITAGLVWAWKIHYAPSGRYANRVVFPCYGTEGLEYFVARSIIPGMEPKIMHPFKGNLWPGKSEVVWGLDHVQPDDDIGITVCEGIFDAAVVPNGVAILGKFISARQVTAIGIRARRVNVMLDGDAAPEAAAIARRFHMTFPRLPISVIRVPADKDPSDMGPDMASEYIIRQTASK
jgi:DNA primase